MLLKEKIRQTEGLSENAGFTEVLNLSLSRMPSPPTVPFFPLMHLSLLQPSVNNFSADAL